MLGGIVNIKLIAPQPYRIFVALLKHCKLVLTDSGGVQEEAPALGKRVLVTRTKTERPEGVKAGVVKLVGTDSKTIVSSMRELMTSDEIELDRSMLKRLYGDGKAALRIIQSIESYF
jgi:UDP-N-acetylglucosamine 2-epimerase (non-hydrolysing)